MRSGPALVLFALLTLLAGVPATPLEAQQLRVGLGGGWYGPGGDDFDETDAGLGLHGSVGLALAPAVEVDAGVQWSRHGVPFADDPYDVVAVYLEPRAYLGDTAALARPYLAARLAWVRQAIEVDTQSRHADGVGGAVEGGVELSLSPRVALQGGVSLGLLDFGAFESDGGTLPGTGSEGNVVGVRLGLRVTP